MTVQSLPSGLRIVRRKPVSSPLAVRLPALRASWIDPFLRGDVWLVPRDPEHVEVMFDQFRVTRIRATRLDLGSLNQLAFMLRHRLPRQIRTAPRAARARKTSPAR